MMFRKKQMEQKIASLEEDIRQLRTEQLQTVQLLAKVSKNQSSMMTNLGERIKLMEDTLEQILSLLSGKPRG